MSVIFEKQCRLPSLSKITRMQNTVQVACWLGFTLTGRPLHIHCSHASRELVKIITLYEPSPAVWLDFRHRRNRNE